MMIFFVRLEGQTYQHLIMYGQSLSNGDQSWPPLSTSPVANNYMIGNQVWINYGNASTITSTFNPLVASLAVSNSGLPKTVSSRMFCESSIVGAANHIQKATGGVSKIVATSCGTSGRSIEMLSKEYFSPTLYADFTKTLNSAYAINNNIHCPALFWMQGEANYSVYPLTFTADNGLLSGGTFTGEKDRYKALMLKLKENMQKDVMATYKQTDKPTFFVYQTGGTFARGKTLEIAMAQLEASNEYSDIVCAGPIYYLPERGGHLDPNGHRWFGEMWGKIYYKTKVLGEDFRPLQPKQILRTSDPKKIIVKFHVPVPPLVFETNIVPKYTDYGFQVYLNGSSTKVSLNSVVINGDAVELTSSVSLAGDVEVVYAGYGTGIGGKGNLRDSDPYQSTTSYIDLDKKKPDGSFVYERDPSVTSLRSPIYEPKATDGSDIYDKPYPLYNFCVGFYYKLNASAQIYDVPNIGSTNPMISVNALNISANTLTLDVGAKANLSATFSPSNATNQSVLWSSSNPGIVSVVKGVITAVGPGTATITATSVDQNCMSSCLVTSNAVQQKAYPNGINPSAVSTIQFENYDIGGEGVAYHDATFGNTMGTFRGDDNVDIVTCTDAGGGYCVNNTEVGEWLEYSVNASIAGSYKITIRYASNAASGLRLEVSGASQVVNLPATYSGTTVAYQSIDVLVNLGLGNQVLKFSTEAAGIYLNYFSIAQTTGNELLELNSSRTLKAYPNPAHSTLYIETFSSDCHSTYCFICDFSGKEIKRTSVKLIEGQNTIKLDVSELPKGNFIISLQSKKGQLSTPFSKLVIE